MGKQRRFFLPLPYLSGSLLGYGFLAMLLRCGLAAPAWQKRGWIRIELQPGRRLAHDGRQEMLVSDKPDNEKQDQPLTFREMLQSVGAAALGVQSGKNRARDFSRGKPSHFVILGVLFTALFVLVIFGVVKLVLHLSGL